MRSYTNQEIAEFLQKIATAYEIKGKSFFRTTSYQNAADTILTYPESVFELWQKDPKIIDSIPGIGDSILKKLDYLFHHNKPSDSVLKALKNIHPAVFTLTKINEIGPKTAFVLSQNFKFDKTDPVRAVDQLIEYARSGQIRKIPHLGEKSEKSILENSLLFLGQKKRMTFKEAKDTADKIISFLKQRFPTTEFYPLGSLRRLAASVGDIDIAAKSEKSEEILNWFIQYPESVQIIVEGPKKASIRIKNDVRVDLMVQPAATFGSLLQHFTGSKQHNIVLRKYAQILLYSLSEYGIKNVKTGDKYEFADEKSLYNFLQLCYIEPKDRLGEGEIDKAKKCYNKQNKNR